MSALFALKAPAIIADALLLPSLVCPPFRDLPHHNKYSSLAPRGLIGGLALYHPPPPPLSSTQPPITRSGFGAILTLKPPDPSAKTRSFCNLKIRLSINRTCSMRSRIYTDIWLYGIMHINNKMQRENIPRVLRWEPEWHCLPDTGFELWIVAVWSRARHLSATEASHNWACKNILL